MSTQYHVYANDGLGGPVDYSTPIATTASLTWTTPSALAANSRWRFAVRAFDTVSGLEENNVDCSVAVRTDGTGADVTNLPAPPSMIAARATKDGGILVQFQADMRRREPNAATSFKIYMGTGGTPNYAVVVATIPAGGGVYRYSHQIPGTGLTDGTIYTVGVRSANLTGVESNVMTADVECDKTGPDNVDDFAITTVV